MKKDMEHRKGAILASVLSVIALVTILNQNLVNKNQSDAHSRTIASVENEAKLKAWKENLLQDLASKSNREIASYGEAPTALDKLKIVELENKYAVVFDGERVSEFVFHDNGDRPKSLRDYSELLNNYKDAFDENIQVVSQVDKKSLNGKEVLIFSAMDAQANAIGTIQVTTDGEGESGNQRLLGIKYIQN